MKFDLLKRYIGPAILCFIIVILAIKVQYWFDGLYNDRVAIRQVIQMLNSGQIEVKRK